LPYRIPSIDEDFDISLATTSECDQECSLDSSLTYTETRQWVTNNDPLFEELFSTYQGERNKYKTYLKFGTVNLETQCTGNLEILESEDLVLGTDERGYHLKIRTGSLLLMDSCQAESVQELAPVLLAYVDLIAAANWYLGIRQAKTFVHSMLPDNSPTSLCHHHSCQSCCQGHHFPRSCQSYCHGCLLMSKVLPEVVGYH
jgi:hypothetical protein